MKKRSKLVSWIALLLIVLVFSCREEDDIFPPEPKNPNPCYSNLDSTSLAIYRQILKAYKTDCDSCMRAVLDEWANQSIPPSPIPSNVEDVYEVFKQMYQPWDSEVLFPGQGYGNNTWPYYIMPATLRYSTSCINLPTIMGFGCGNTYTLSDFSPTILNDTIGVLYSYNNDYMSAVKCFLGANKGSLGFLQKYFRTGQYKMEDIIWETAPINLQIHFNDSMDLASVEHQTQSQWSGGQVFLTKQSGAWVADSAWCCWIE